MEVMARFQLGTLPNLGLTEGDWMDIIIFKVVRAFPRYFCGYDERSLINQRHETLRLARTGNGSMQ